MLEQVIRPYAAPGSLATQRVIADNTQVTVTRARLSFGAAGTLPPATIETPAAAAGFKTENCDTGLTETPGSRKTEKIRVENPNDSSQYVMLERITSVAFLGQPSNQPPVFAGSETTAFATMALGSFGGAPIDVPAGAGGCTSTFTLANN